MYQRDAAREARELALASKNKGSVIRVSADMDEYGEMLRKVRAAPPSLSSSRPFRPTTAKIPRLSTLCAQVLSTHIDSLEELGEPSDETKIELLAELATCRRLSPETLLLVVCGHRRSTRSSGMHSGMASLILPDCSAIDEDTLVSALRAAANPTPSGSEGDEGGGGVSCLRVLELHNCGHGLTAWAAAQLSANSEVLGQLEVLRLGGMYRLSDANLEVLIRSVGKGQDCTQDLPSSPYFSRGKNTTGLRSLSLSHTNAVGALSVRAMCETFLHLQELRLEGCSLEAPALEGLCLALASSSPLLRSLVHLCVAGCDALSDEHVCQLLSGTNPSAQLRACSSSSAASTARNALGARLTVLSLRDCQGITDKALRAIREHCLVLQELDVSRALALTTEGLLDLFQEVSHEG